MSVIGNPTIAFNSRSAGQMAALRSAAERLQEQIATGERLTRSSDDPVAGALLRRLGRSDRLAAVERENAGRAASNLTLAGEALSQMASDLVRIRELAVQATSGTQSVAARQAIGVEIMQLRTGIIASANSKDAAGGPLFAGTAGAPAYVLSATGEAIYMGAPDPGTLRLDDQEEIPSGVVGPQFMTFSSGGAQVDLTGLLKELSDRLQAGMTADSAILTQLDDALGTISRTQTVVGARLAYLDTVRDRLLTAEVARAQSAADAGGVDFATSIARLQETLTALEAAQAGYARLSSLTLFAAL
ncbi:flagellar biosynthesis protein FlgL [Porphyrobacter sp. GA68]|uniref:flagellin N-terminal helical domain-containing protein n=1 Tax=Porphyrobacter sp. GA68 TaxID=2883480 RepID=UPI001D1913E4|nr:flagellar biosynthesis protein FlgL [Porphyrobacter sp. GA68]